MSKCAPWLLVLACLVGWSASAAAATVTLQPNESTSEDVFAYEFLGNDNLDNYNLGPIAFGKLLATSNTNGSGHDIHSLLRFDLSSTGLVYPGQVQSAALKLRVIDSKTVGFPVTNPTAALPVNVDVFKVTEAWSETKVTWNTLPDADAGSIASAKVTGINQTATFALTDAVKGWVSQPITNDGVLLTQRESKINPDNSQYVGVVFASSAFGSNLPLLEITLTPNKAGDANFDGLVDGVDYTIWADHFLETGASFVTGDFTGDGKVDGADYTVWADNFAPGPLLSVAAVPEPASVVLAAMALPALVYVAGRASRRRYPR